MSESRKTQLRAFVFLQLPAEIRVMVYELLHIHTIRETLPGKMHPQDKKGSIVIIRRALPIQLLATCRLIEHEAKDILLPRVAKVRSCTDLPKIAIPHNPIRFFKLGGRGTRAASHSLMRALRDWLTILQSNSNACFHTWKDYQDTIPYFDKLHYETGLFKFIQQTGIIMENRRNTTSDTGSFHPLMLKKWSQRTFEDGEDWANEMLREPIRCEMLIRQEDAVECVVRMDWDLLEQKVYVHVGEACHMDGWMETEELD
ncbi:hypothetical protein BCR34DRAFT_587592 [Clohesyomyces aquaticus]|uniref:F-box domain-containing protein n=1 Tax=Clohesyomyces aquaticus TaxID=1231657 RepID=A0A1Y1ZNS6_9PLEO|nr:hypothetical protein BCR34DRAFT_587592 [Clohesyomyces aquaticus]